MGLDILAVNNIKKMVVEEPLTSHVYISTHSHFPNHSGDLTNGYYTYDNRYRFRAGGYSGYNKWRNDLAKLIGETAESIWENPKPGPFVELINFSDCEGTIGAEMCKKLLGDFKDWDTKAKVFGDSLSDDGCFYYIYSEFKKAFALASNNGALLFI